MSELSRARQMRQADSKGRLHLTAVISLLTGAMLLAGGAFLLSYDRIHEMALTAGVSPSLAALYPLMFDTTLVIACVAALALHGARWWVRGYAALAITILLGVVAVAEAVHSAGISLPYGPTAAAFAAMPWVLFLLGFSMGLLVLRYVRMVRAMAQADDAGEETESVSKPDAAVLSVFQREDQPRLRKTDPDRVEARLIQAGPEPASPRPSQLPVTPELPVTPDATPTPASAERHGQAHSHHHHTGGDHTGSS